MDSCSFNEMKTMMRGRYLSKEPCIQLIRLDYLMGYTSC